MTEHISLYIVDEFSVLIDILVCDGYAKEMEHLHDTQLIFKQFVVDYTINAVNVIIRSNELYRIRSRFVTDQL